MRKKFYALLITISLAAGLFLWAQSNDFKKNHKTINRILLKKKLYRKIQKKYKTNKKIIKNKKITKLEKTAAMGTIFFVLGFIVIRFKTKTKDNILNKISEEIDIVIKEKTEDFVLKNGKPKEDKNGRKIHVIKEYYPKYDFSKLPKYFLIKGVNPRAEKNLFIYLHGLLDKLKAYEYIKTSSGKALSTGFPGEYKILLNNQAKIGEMEFFKDIRWYKETTINGIKKELYPTVEIGAHSVIVVLNGIQLTAATIERGLEKFQKFNKVKLKDMFKQEDDIIEFSYQTELKRVFDKEDIPTLWEEWNEKIVDPMKEKYAKTGVEEIFLGELEDPNVSWNTQIYWKLTQSPHLLVVGQTRSGKTRSVLSLVSTLKRAYPTSPFLFADGKGSVDYDPFAERMSRYAVAKPAQDNDPLIELANIIMIAWNEYEKRKEQLESLKKSSGKSFTSYVQYNELAPENEKMPRYFIVIDEFAAFVTLSPVAADKLLTAEGSIFYYLNRLLRESASVGFTIVIASQRAQATDIPTTLRSNLTSWLIHSVNSKDAGFLGVEGHVEKQSSGKYILKTPGLWCPDTGQTLFKMSLPYIGDNEGTLLDLLDLELMEHEEFNNDLLYNSGLDLNGKSLDIKTVYKHIKQAFIIREGYSVIESFDPEFNYISLIFSDSENRDYAIGVVNVDEVSDIGFAQKVKNERSDYYKYMTLFFVIGKNGRLPAGMSDALPRSAFLFEHDYTRKLKEALELNKVRDEKKVFPALLENNFVNEEMVDEIYYENAKKEDTIINIKELNRVRNISGNIEKGDAFEDWYQSFEKRQGFETVKTDDLINEGIFPDIFSSKRADGGLDLCRWIDKENKIAIAIQCKNYTSKALNSDPIDKMLKTRELYKAKGIVFESLLLVTSGKLTKQAMKEAEFCGVAVIDGSKLEEMIKEFNKTPDKKVKLNIKEPKIEKKSTKTTEKPEKVIKSKTIPSDELTDEDKELIKLFGAANFDRIKSFSPDENLINKIIKEKK